MPHHSTRERACAPRMRGSCHPGGHNVEGNAQTGCAHPRKHTANIVWRGAGARPPLPQKLVLGGGAGDASRRPAGSARRSISLSQGTRARGLSEMTSCAARAPLSPLPPPQTTPLPRRGGAAPRSGTMCAADGASRSRETGTLRAARAPLCSTSGPQQATKPLEEAGAWACLRDDLLACIPALEGSGQSRSPPQSTSLPSSSSPDPCLSQRPRHGDGSRLHRHHDSSVPMGYMGPGQEPAQPGPGAWIWSSLQPTSTMCPSRDRDEPSTAHSAAQPFPSCGPVAWGVNAERERHATCPSRAIATAAHKLRSPQLRLQARSLRL
jgi:hypothetical protein